MLWCVLLHVAIPTGAWFCTLGSLTLHFKRCMPSRPSQGFCCHFFRWRSSDFTYYDRAIYSVISTEPPTVISTERSEWRNLYVVRGTVVGIYDLRRLQRRRCGELDPEGLSSRLAVARISPQMSRLSFFIEIRHPECSGDPESCSFIGT